MYSFLSHRQSQQCLGVSLLPSALPSPGNHWIFLCRNIACLTWHECSVLAQCFIYFKLILDSTVGVKNWIISIFFKQKAIISHVSPDILYLFRVQAVCRNEMRSDFSQTMLFQGKKPTYIFLHWTILCFFLHWTILCLFNIFFAECNMMWSYFRRYLNTCRQCQFHIVSSDLIWISFPVRRLCLYLSLSGLVRF